MKDSLLLASSKRALDRSMAELWEVFVSSANAPHSLIRQVQTKFFRILNLTFLEGISAYRSFSFLIYFPNLIRKGRWKHAKFARTTNIGFQRKGKPVEMFATNICQRLKVQAVQGTDGLEIRFACWMRLVEFTIEVAPTILFIDSSRKISLCQRNSDFSQNTSIC